MFATSEHFNRRIEVHEGGLPLANKPGVAVLVNGSVPLTLLLVLFVLVNCLEFVGVVRAAVDSCLQGLDHHVVRVPREDLAARAGLTIWRAYLAVAPGTLRQGRDGRGHRHW